MDQYVFDACSLVAYFNGETGADKVKDILEKAEKGDCITYMNKLNVYEIYYGFLRDDGSDIAESTLATILAFPINIIDKLDDSVFKEAARLKTKYKMSVADSIALAEAKVRDAQLVTSDHHEFDIIDEAGEVKIYWFR
ncbi:MAG: type II toxin-antitoxin system VapC family toxin [bacterium]|nr:type II toxin-antitoxin system VapC family toxin [bacterium]